MQPLCFKEPTASLLAIPCANVQILAADAKGPRRFRVLAYGGGAIEVGAFDLPVVVDLDGLEKRNTLVANLDHKAEQRVGHCDDMDTSGGVLIMSGLFSAATPHRDEVLRSADDGFKWQASIEAVPGRERGAIEMVRPDEIATANGKEFEGPCYIVRSSLLKGFAFVSHGADPGTEVNIAATATPTAQPTMDDYGDLIAWGCAYILGQAESVPCTEATADLICEAVGKTNEDFSADLDAAIEAYEG